MRLADANLALRRAAQSAVFRVTTVARVALEKRLASTLRPGGAWLLARELPKGRPSASLLFRYQAHNDPHRTALVWEGKSGKRSYSAFEVNDRMDRVAAALARRGLGKGSAAMIMLKNRAEFVLLQGGIGRLGASAVSVSYRSTPVELEFLAENSGARAIFFDVDAADTIRAAIPSLRGVPRENLFVVGGTAEGFTTFDELLSQARPGDAPADQGDEAAVISYTSGTTGKPKGAVRRFPKDALVGALAFIGETPMQVGDVHLAVCPLYHATAFGFIGLSAIVGAKIVLLEHFDPEAFLAAIERYRVTTTAVVPTMLHRVLELGPELARRYDTSSLTAVFTGGAPLPAQVALDFMDRFGDKLYNFYGATETGLVTLASPADLRASPGTIGRAIPGCEIRLVTDAGREARTNEVGELYVRSTLLVEGYHGDEGSTRASMLDGFFSVGDLARRDERGLFHIEGRKRDMIISGGVNVYPAEVEAAIEQHPSVGEVAVVGVPDREWGERVRAFVVARPGAHVDAGEIVAHCRARLAGPKVPRDVVVLDALPRNPTGKVLKRELRTWSTDAASAAPHEGSSPSGGSEGRHG